jgi:flagellar biosynthesis component FlhA
MLSGTHRRAILAAVGSLVVVVLALAVAGLVRAKTAAGLLGRRESYGRPMSDWAALSVLGLGLGLAALVAGAPNVAFLLLAAVLAESYATIRQVRPRRR